MTTRDEVIEMVDRLESFFDNYEKKGKTFRQFWDEAGPRIYSVRDEVMRLGDVEVIKRLNFAMAAADQSGLLYSQDNLDRLISEGPSLADLGGTAT